MVKLVPAVRALMVGGAVAAVALQVTLKAVLRLGSSCTRMVEVAVTDNGQDLSADKLLHVFEPFYTTKPNGLGMGLAISRSIVEAHGGQLRAENNPTGGATFTFTLPAAKGEGGDQ